MLLKAQLYPSLINWEDNKQKLLTVFFHYDPATIENKSAHLNKDFKEKTHENEYSYEVKVRYNFTSRFYTESIFSQLWYLRPEQLEQEYSDTFGKIDLFYSF